ncbi:hypothetical protein QTP88_010730 [Uroleucon formosanum]
MAVSQSATQAFYEMVENILSCKEQDERLAEAESASSTLISFLSESDPSVSVQSQIRELLNSRQRYFFEQSLLMNPAPPECCRTGMFADDQVSHAGRVCAGGFLPAHPNPRKPSSQQLHQSSVSVARRASTHTSIPHFCQFGENYDVRSARVSPGNPVGAHHTYYGMPSPVVREKHVSLADIPLVAPDHTYHQTMLLPVLCHKILIKMHLPRAPHDCYFIFYFFLLLCICRFIYANPPKIAYIKVQTVVSNGRVATLLTSSPLSYLVKR